jgi:flagellar hook-basal body complex protein FliE
MVVNVSDVMSVYKKSGGMIDDAGSNAGAPAAGGGQSFADALQDFAGNAITTLHDSEKAAVAHISGTNTDLAGVGAAISKAEITLDEITTVRDKVITAYQAITSSAI